MRTLELCSLAGSPNFFPEPMDVGVWMRAEVLADKLEARYASNPEQTWNLSRWPARLSGAEGEHRLFVAIKGAWRGYFTLSRDALYSPNDASAPFSLLFDTRTWTPIQPVPVKCFRGFTYNVPRPMPAGGTASASASP
jgi:hypothetical protein